MRFRQHQDAARTRSRRLLLLFGLSLLGLAAATHGALLLGHRLLLPAGTPLPPWFLPANVGLVLTAVLGGWAFEHQRLRAQGGAHLARLAGGLPARDADGRPRDAAAQRLLNIVEELALAARMPAPQAWVLPDAAHINAFAAGWGGDDAVIALTRGALERLDRAELQGVVAHELGHLQQGDTLLNMRLVGMVWGLEMLHGYGRGLAFGFDAGSLREGLGRLLDTASPPPAGLRWRGRHGPRAGEGPAGRHPLLLGYGLVLMVLGGLGWLAGQLLKAAVLRQREYLADAIAVQLTRHPEGLGRALRKIAGEALGPAEAPAPAPTAGSLAADLARVPHLAAFSHLLLQPPGRAAWRASHPPLAERIRRLYGGPRPPLRATRLSEDDAGPDRAAPASGSAAADGRTAGTADALAIAPVLAAVGRGGAAPAGDRPRPADSRPALSPSSPPSPHPPDPAATPAGASRGTAPAAASPIPPRRDPLGPHADATQRPEHSDARALEREALDHLDRWIGPGELRAALLWGLLAPPILGPAGAAAGAPADPHWQQACAAVPRCPALAADLAALGAATRQAGLRTLRVRCGGGAPAERRALAREAFAWARAGRLAGTGPIPPQPGPGLGDPGIGDARSGSPPPASVLARPAATGPADPGLLALRALHLRAALRQPGPPPWIAPRPGNALADLGAEVARLSHSLARVLRPQAGASDWDQRAAQVLRVLDLPTPARRPGWRRALGRLAGLRTLDRPRLLRAWLDLAGRDLALQARPVELMVLVTELLALPHPPELTAALAGDPWPAARLDDAEGDRATLIQRSR